MIDFPLPIVEDDRIPPTTLIVMNPRYDADGNLDIQATAKASLRIDNIGVNHDNQDGSKK